MFILVLRLLELLVSFPYLSIQLMFPVVVMNCGGFGGAAAATATEKPFKKTANSRGWRVRGIG